MTNSEIINSIIAMSKDQQAAFYNGLRDSGISENDILTIQKQVFFTKLFDDPMFFEEVQNMVACMAYEALTNE